MIKAFMLITVILIGMNLMPLKKPDSPSTETAKAWSWFIRFCIFGWGIYIILFEVA